MVAVQERCKPCRNLKEFWSVNLNYWNSGKGKPACNQLFVMCGVCSLENRQLLCQTASSWAHYVMSSSRQALLKERQSQKVWVISESSRSKPGSLRPECWNSIWTWRENCIDAKTRCECDHNLLRKASASTSIVTAHIHFWPIARSGRLSPSPFRSMPSRAAVKHEAGETLGQLGIGRTRLTMEIDSFAVLKLHVSCSLWLLQHSSASPYLESQKFNTSATSPTLRV